jgi:alkylation response protein AidB-like acyl-CoA dehydrogenase
MFHFGLNADQQALQTSVRRYAEVECALPAVRKIVEASDRFSTSLWQGIGELGLIGVGIPEEYGGSGLGCVDTMAVTESLGRVPFPGPYLETVVVAYLIANSGTDVQKASYLQRLAVGQLVATYAIDEPGGYWNADAVQASAVRAGENYRLQGSKLWVPYANVAELIICAVRTSRHENSEAGISLIALDPKQLKNQINVLDSMDDTYHLCEIDLNGVVVAPAQFIGEKDHGWEIWVEARRLATVLASAEMVGGMEKCLEMTVAYSKERVQFGKPIGSYQAIKHRCADMLMDLEASRGSVYYAAWALQNRGMDVDVAVSSAKASASDAYVRVAERALQTFGAIGFTWEHDIHFYLKRAKRLEVTLGDATFHREHIAASWL